MRHATSTAKEAPSRAQKTNEERLDWVPFMRSRGAPGEIGLLIAIIFNLFDSCLRIDAG